MATYRSELYVPVDIDKRSSSSSNTAATTNQGQRERHYSQPYHVTQQSCPQPLYIPPPSYQSTTRRHRLEDLRHQRYPSAGQLIHVGIGGSGGMNHSAAGATAASGFGRSGTVGGSLSSSATGPGTTGGHWFDVGAGGSMPTGVSNRGSATVGRSGFSHNDMMSDDPLGAYNLHTGAGMGDVWYDEMKRRFDERKRRWDDDIRRMRDEFFKDPFLETNALPGTSAGNLACGNVGESAGTGRISSGVGVKHELSTNEVSQPVTTTYERSPDGQLHFIARFTVSDFSPEQVKVSVRQNQLVVTARHEQRLGASSSSREFTRSVDLPRNVVETNITATVMADGQLVVDCPLRNSGSQLPLHQTHITGRNSPNIDSVIGVSTATAVPLETSFSGTKTRGFGTSLGLTGGRHSPPSFATNIVHPAVPGGIGHIGVGHYGATPGTLGVSNSGSAQLHNGPKFHLEIPIGTDYLPTEIQIRTLNQRVYINARHEERTANRTAFREFSKEYDIPENVDPQSVEARLEGGCLHIEATKI